MRGFLFPMSVRPRFLSRRKSASVTRVAMKPILWLSVCLAAVLVGCDTPLGATLCPPSPPGAIDITLVSSPQRNDLIEAVATAITELARRAGFEAVTQTRTNRAAEIVTPVCVPVLAVVISTGVPQAFMASVTWYFEPVSVRVTLVLPDGSIRRSNQTESARWFGDYASFQYAPGPPLTYPSSLVTGPTHQHAEHIAAVRAATTAAQRLLPALSSPSP
jgi:hypothetical protein